MTKANSGIARTLLSFTILAMIFAGIAVTTQTGFVASQAAAFPPDSFTAYCNYNPNDPVFKAGTQKKYHPTHSAQMDTWIILLPNVRQQTTPTGIGLLTGDRVTLRACGCVQTGGVGKTWKRYVNPSGPDSDRLYHGVMALDGINIIPPKGQVLEQVSSPTIPGAIRISKMIDAQNRGFIFQVRTPTVLVLGYEDGKNDYGDNGYSGHDDGTEDQCKSVGGAAVEMTITRKAD
jgi:hypothetical protein